MTAMTAREVLARKSRIKPWEPVLWLAAFAAPLLFPSYAQNINEVAIVALFAVALIWLIALATYEPTDPVWFFNAGVDGVLLVDCPPEEAGAFHAGFSVHAARTNRKAQSNARRRIARSIGLEGKAKGKRQKAKAMRQERK